MNNTDKNNKNKIIITILVIIIFAIILGIGIFFLIKYLNSKVEEEKNRYRDFNVTADANIETVDENNVQEEITNEQIIDDYTQILNKSYGKIELIWVDKDNNILKTPEKPVLNEMQPVRFNRQDANFETIQETDSNWYDYSTKQWANAIDENGSYFVWIPRYAYKIVYYSDKNLRNPIGYCDARGVLKINEDGTLTRVLKNNNGLKEIGNHYILHPAFSNDYPSRFLNGGWDDNLSGIWVSKFEVSMEENGNNVVTDNTQIGNVTISDSIKLVSKPAVSSWRNIYISNAYYNAYNYNRERDSHLMKNSEWGAIAYLTYSKYGLNANLPKANTSKNYFTGNSQTVSEVYNNNKDETSNGNQTGVYDLSGGSWEYVSAFVNNGTPMSVVYGKNLLENSKNNKYITVYNNDKSDIGINKYDKKYADANFLMNTLLRGDAVFETSNNGYGNYSWETNTSYYVQQDVPFFVRGGDLSSGAGAGLFSYNGSSGQASVAQGYRVVLAFN
ncbi:MAG: hypothetical protein IKG56_01160 [Clostridia bacterium]|nr:hypothetical protein [Clostridia bacterium]